MAEVVVGAVDGVAEEVSCAVGLSDDPDVVARGVIGHLIEITVP